MTMQMPTFSAGLTPTFSNQGTTQSIGSPFGSSAARAPTAPAPSGGGWQSGMSATPTAQATNPMYQPQGSSPWWFPPSGSGMQQPAGWQPMQYGYGSVPIGQPPPAYAPPPRAVSVASQALKGGAAGLQAYLQALKQVGAGGNNAQMTGGPVAPAQAPQFMQNLAGYGGSAGGASYVGGFNGGYNQVSYNLGLGAGGGGTYGGQGQGGGGGYQFGPTQIGQGVLGGNLTSWGQQSADPTNPLPGYGVSSPQYQQPTIGGSTGVPRGGSEPSQPSTSYSASMPALSSQSGATNSTGTMPALTFSDETLKQDIEPATAGLRRYLDSMGEPKEYEYIDPKHGDGKKGTRYVSPMAQELEKSEVGRAAVVETPQGKMVNYARLMGAMVSTDAWQHQRIDELESKLESLYKRMGKGARRG